LKKTKRGESLSYAEQEIKTLDRLKEIHLTLINDFGESWNLHQILTMRRQTLSRILYYDHLYKKVLNKPGVICEFGVQWGGVLATLMNLRGMYEPYNHHRKIYGFDTFEGFPSVSQNDDGGVHNVGDFSVTDGYVETLDEILRVHESQSPIAHIKKYSLVKGDVSSTIHQWLDDNPGLAIAMAIFDMDLYRPTKDVLEAIKPRLFKGSILAFDEFSCSHWPGETTAINEILGLNNLKLEGFSHQSGRAFCIYE